VGRTLFLGVAAKKISCFCQESNSVVCRFFEIEMVYLKVVFIYVFVTNKGTYATGSISGIFMSHALPLRNIINIWCMIHCTLARKIASNVFNKIYLKLYCLLPEYSNLFSVLHAESFS
jgi:hypothetical protein